MTSVAGRPARTRQQPALPDGIRTRPATEADLGDCAAIWKAGIDDYIVRLNQPPVPADTSGLTKLHAHTRSTDPDLFRVATRGDRIVAFGSAVRRDRLWFLSMLFVLPEEQGTGLGRALLGELLPEETDHEILATATDALQPISNALYAGYGMVPRTPILDMTGRPRRPEAFGSLPDGLSAEPFDQVAAGPGGGGALEAAVEALDAEIVGLRHPQDHAFIRAQGRRGFLYRYADGEAVAYAYGAPSGRLGPIATRDDALFGPILGHLTTVLEPAGDFAVWVPGQAGAAVVALLHAGFRLDGFPLLLCWSGDFADFRRYVPISPGLL
jgi:GNAT superfamily N-acetyltransferase